jgi:hypothetical protein
MPRLALALVLIAVAGGATAQEDRSVLETIGDIDAADYIRGVLANDRYDPRDRQSALGDSDITSVTPHWRSTIFDGRRTRSTRGTGIQLPDLIDREVE